MGDVWPQMTLESLDVVVNCRCVVWLTWLIAVLIYLSIFVRGCRVTPTTVIWKSCKILDITDGPRGHGSHFQQLYHYMCISRAMMWFLWTKFRLHDNVDGTTTFGRAQTGKTSLTSHDPALLQSFNPKSLFTHLFHESSGLSSCQIWLLTRFVCFVPYIFMLWLRIA